MEMSKRKFSDNIQRFYKINLKALDVCRELNLAIEAKGFNGFFITFDISDGVLLVNEDSDQWQISQDIIDLIYSCESQEELELRLHENNKGL